MQTNNQQQNKPVEDRREPFYIYLQHSELNTNLQKYISAFVQHIASILEKDEPGVKRVISFLPERNGEYSSNDDIFNIYRNLIVWFSFVNCESNLQIFEEIR